MRISLLYHCINSGKLWHSDAILASDQWSNVKSFNAMLFLGKPINTKWSEVNTKSPTFNLNLNYHTRQDNNKCFVFGFCISWLYIGQQIAVTLQRVIYTELLLDQSLIWVNLILFAVTWYTGTQINHPPRIGFFLNLNLLRMHFSPLFYAIKLISPMQWNGFL